MSRLYEALKEATRGGRQSGGSGRQAWDALGLDGIDIRPGGPQPPPPTQELPIEVPPPDVEIPPEAAPAETGGDAEPYSSATVALDQRARLIPHAVNPAIVEHYRRLRTKIMRQHAEKRIRSLLITSANPQEGKSVTTLNLALSFAVLPSVRVLVVDGDLRRGTLGSWLGVDSRRPGLSNLIDGSAGLDEVVVSSGAIPMHFMLRGNSRVPAGELLNSPEMAGHFRRMAERFDLVLVDSPPVNPITDVQLLAPACDAVLLVVRAFSTTRKSLEKAVQDLGTFRVIGTVLNAGTVQVSRKYGGYYY
jgi:capsular exopolysaccharide synthesis family protein